jgi:glycosyltransferase involved in cell wall biosynthesis
MPLKIAGEIQPIYRDYWETRVKPLVDGRFIEYVGEADHAAKNELLGHATALLFPIQWEEPFGLVMIEAMACGTPVLAFRGGAVVEVVANGVSGWVCRDIDEMAFRAANVGVSPASCRRHVEKHFSIELMARRYEAVYQDAITRRTGLYLGTAAREETSTFVGGLDSNTAS